jgi:hypothetical protein
LLAVASLWPLLLIPVTSYYALAITALLCAAAAMVIVHVVEQRAAWRDSQESIDPAKIVFIDETWASTNMTRTHGRCPRGGPWWSRT